MVSFPCPSFLSLIIIIMNPSKRIFLYRWNIYSSIFRFCFFFRGENPSELNPPFDIIVATGIASNQLLCYYRCFFLLPIYLPLICYISPLPVIDTMYLQDEVDMLLRDFSHKTTEIYIGYGRDSYTEDLFKSKLIKHRFHYEMVLIWFDLIWYLHIRVYLS